MVILTAMVVLLVWKFRFGAGTIVVHDEYQDENDDYEEKEERKRKRRRRRNINIDINL